MSLLLRVLPIKDRTLLEKKSFYVKTTYVFTSVVLCGYSHSLMGEKAFSPQQMYSLDSKGLPRCRFPLQILFTSWIPMAKTNLL